MLSGLDSTSDAPEVASAATSDQPLKADNLLPQTSTEQTVEPTEVQFKYLMGVLCGVMNAVNDVID